MSTVDEHRERYVGLWAVSLAHELFRIESVEQEGPRLYRYRGTGLHGQPVATRVPTIFPVMDQAVLDDHLNGGEQ